MKLNLRVKALIKFSKDKFSSLTDQNKMASFNFSNNELLYLINTFLSNEQKAKLFDYEYYNNLPASLKNQIIEGISDNNTIAELLENPNVTSGLDDDYVENLAISLDDHNKIRLLSNPKFIQRLQASHLMGFTGILESLSEEKKAEILLNSKFIEQELGIEKHKISHIISTLENETSKRKFIEFYQLSKDDTLYVLCSFSDKSKKEILLNNEFTFDNGYLILLSSSLSTNGLVDFFKNSHDFLVEHNISPYEIIPHLTIQGQLDFITQLEDTGLSLGEKRQILAMLSLSTKRIIDTSNFPQEYITALEMRYLHEKVIVDLDKDPEIYRDLESLASINPRKIRYDDKDKLAKLFEVCPQISVTDYLNVGSSTVEEYNMAEAWIESVIQGIDATWTDIQKVAFIDNAIGKKMSYSPDFETEVYDYRDSRPLWKIVCSGYGVCNGIAQLEQYILEKVGIEVEMVDGNCHTFLRLKNIELPNSDGSINKGDTLLDPTWNLVAHKYGAKPNNFCKSYEEIRKEDIDASKIDHKCHKNDEELSDVTLSLDEQSLRNVFSSIGLANKEGDFRISSFITMSDVIGNLAKDNSIKSMEMQLKLVAEYRPDFATFNNSTATILNAISLKHENLKFNRCVVNRVYERSDNQKRPVLYVYADFPNEGNRFYFADKDSRTFVQLSQKDFEERFECYEMDMAKQSGHRPWEWVEPAKTFENLAQSSGKVAAREEEEK